MTRRTLLTIVALAIGFVMAACDDGPSGDRNRPTGVASLAPLAGGEPRLDPLIIAVGNPNSVVLPLMMYVWDDATVRIVNRARILVGDACMRRYGFSPLPWQPEGQSTMVEWSRYGLWEDAALQIGYEGPASTENSEPVRFMSAEASDVYFGLVKDYKGIPVQKDGCQAEEYVKVFVAAGASGTDMRYVDDLDQEARTRAKQDSRVVSGLDKWTSCMKAAGWKFKDVLEPFGFWSTRRGTDKARPVVSEAEKRSARDDLGCKRSTGLLNTWLAVDIAYQNAIIQRDGERLREYRRLLDAVLANANRIIADG